MYHFGKNNKLTKEDTIKDAHGSGKEIITWVFPRNVTGSKFGPREREKIHIA